MKKTLFTAVFGFFFSGTLMGQLNFDFNNRHLPQSALSNPAFLPQYKFNFGIRNTTGLSLDQFTLNTLFNKNESDSASIANLIKANSKTLGTDINSKTDIFHFGIRSKKAYFSFNSGVVVEGAIRIPRDLFGLAFFGNGAYINKTASLDFAGTQFTSYLKNQISYGRQVSNELSIGASFSVLNGIANMNLEKGFVDIRTDTGVASIYQLTMSSEILGKTSFMGIDPTLLSDSAYSANIGNQTMDEFKTFNLSTNRGYSIDFGAVYRINEKFRISANISNLGSIVWNKGAMIHSMPKSTWIFSGLDTTQFKQLQKNDSNDIFTQIQDSFNIKFNRNSEKVSSYQTNLKPRFTIGFEFFPWTRTNVQMLFGSGYGVLGDKSFISTGIHQEIGEIMDLRANYTLYDFNFPQHRIGIGASLNLGIIQPYFSISDVLGAVDYGYASTVAGSVGLNFMIGMQKDKDNDGVPDKRDSCRKVFGVISNNGCPYGFLGESMNNEEQIKDDAPVFEIVPADSVSDPSKAKVNSMQIQNQNGLSETPTNTEVSMNSTSQTNQTITTNTISSKPSSPNSSTSISNPSIPQKRSGTYNLKVIEMTNIMKK